ncbi:hypothetical protein AOA80_01525 [Methanomassiliicoccales archaeon RumEn M1]|jgi:hypothetical protein|nr:hypothetical protein AOA80_01525 [Methanomassiliicoccales archaeon RumEn M1]
MIDKVALASISVVAAVACFFLGVYVIGRNRHLASSRVFFAVTMAAALSALFDFLIITASDAAQAGHFARGIVFNTVLLAGGMIHLAFLIPFERRDSLVIRHRWTYAALIVALGGSMAAGGIEASEDQYGWWVLLNEVSLLWYATMVLMFFVSTVILVLAYRRERSEEERRRLLPLIAGMAVPVLSSLQVAKTVMVDAIEPPLLSVIILSTCLFVGYGVFRQKLFVLEPVKERVQGSPDTPRMGAGGVVLVETKTDDLAYRMFVNEIASGGQGLLISRRHPVQLREQYGLSNTPMLWLTTKPGAGHIDPGSLSLLLHSVVGFLEKSSEAIVLLDGLEYLETYNKDEAIMQFIYGLRDAVTVTGSKLIVSVDPMALRPQVLPRLEREMDIIKR